MEVKVYHLHLKGCDVPSVLSTILPSIDLGGKYNFEALIAEIRVDALLQKCIEACNYVFLLKWRGSKVPRGAVIGGHKIIWTQHGKIMTGEEGKPWSGKHIGYYQRLIEFGGKDQDEHLMLAYLRPGISPQIQ